MYVCVHMGACRGQKKKDNKSPGVVSYLVWVPRTQNFGKSSRCSKLLSHPSLQPLTLIFGHYMVRSLFLLPDMTAY